MLDKEYFFHCRGCKKPDKEYPIPDYDIEEELQDKQIIVPRVTYHMWARADAYGIYTGLYCDKCYNDKEKYTYRKDRYHDEAYCGERMNPDE